jgi:pyrrolidone-carboxylate peptidase
MKTWTLLGLLFVAFQAMAQDKSVLITAFDPYGDRSVNNSTRAANDIIPDLRKQYPNIHFKFCQLPTIYDKGFEVLKDCYHNMKTKPMFIISMGAGKCEGVSLETATHNWDKDSGEDNDGVIRSGQVIIDGAPKSLGINLPLNQAYCGVDSALRKYIRVPKSPDNFVCNNTIFRTRHELSNIPMGFFHVPGSSCWMNRTKRRRTKTIMLSIISTFIKSFEEQNSNKGLPSFANNMSWPVSKYTVSASYQTKIDQLSSCEKEFFHKLLSSY